MMIIMLLVLDALRWRLFMVTAFVQLYYCEMLLLVVLSFLFLDILN